MVKYLWIQGGEFLTPLSSAHYYLSFIIYTPAGQKKMASRPSFFFYFLAFRSRHATVLIEYLSLPLYARRAPL